MKRFVFRLESVLSLRRFELDTRKRELGVALSRVARVERDIDSACESASIRAADFVANAKRGIKAGRASFEAHSVEQGFRSWRIHQLSLVEATRLVDEARGEVTRALTKVLALEKLQERALEAHALEASREEVRELDEVAGRMGSLTRRLGSNTGVQVDVRDRSAS